MNKQKKFYYTGKTYQNATFTEEYTRISRWKRIFYNAAGNPYFMQDGKRHYIDNYTRTNYPAGDYTEIKAADGEKATLHAIQSDEYYKPYLIELDEGGENVRVYQYERTETDYN